VTRDGVATARVVDRASGQAVVEFRLRADYPGFDGHFPGEPVLPGMCHIDLAVQAAECVFSTPLRLAAVRRARFTRKVVPGEALEVWLDWDEPRGFDAEGTLRCRVRHAVGEESVAELELVLERVSGAYATERSRGTS
jgi:3-hydroxymyristoyl/3-hydroxydecanoyl-(acyl carrier protein) dehydratase